MKATVTQPRVLAKVPSKTNPTKSYEIRLGADGVVYCTCYAWISNKFCKHLEEYHTKAQQSVPGSTKDAMLKFFEDTAKAAGVGLVDNRDYVTRIVQDGIIGGKWNV